MKPDWFGRRRRRRRFRHEILLLIFPINFLYFEGGPGHWMLID